MHTSDPSFPHLSKMSCLFYLHHRQMTLIFTWVHIALNWFFYTGSFICKFMLANLAILWNTFSWMVAWSMGQWKQAFLYYPTPTHSLKPPDRQGGNLLIHILALTFDWLFLKHRTCYYNIHSHLNAFLFQITQIFSCFITYMLPQWNVFNTKW